MITIYTRTSNPLKKEFWKHVARKAIRKYTGPDAVLDSLKRGLTDANIPFEVNPILPKYKTVHVISGTTILAEMIAKKKNHKINVLLAGPTLVQTPFDHDSIVQDTDIDMLLFPSQWTKDFYVSLVPALADTIKIWPAGVSIPKETSSKQKVLIFKKNIPEDIYQHVMQTLNEKSIQYDIITYGTFSKKSYHKKLLSASALVYLQMTESQGLALQEAWSYDVPALVWHNTTWSANGYSWNDEKISAPYLSEQSGLFFTKETFSAALDTIINKQNNFKPRDYCIEHLSDKASIRKYLEIIKNYVK